MNLQARLVHLLMHKNDTIPESISALESQKYIILLAMFLTTICFGILPLRILYLNQRSSTNLTSHHGENDSQRLERRQNNNNRTKRWRKMISFANCFSGGVFVGACLLDLFPGKVLRHK